MSWYRGMAWCFTPQFENGPIPGCSFILSMAFHVGTPRAVLDELVPALLAIPRERVAGALSHGFLSGFQNVDVGRRAAHNSGNTNKLRNPITYTVLVPQHETLNVRTRLTIP